MLLSANGVQDMFITGIPSQSHFLTVYKQHTPFYKTVNSIESESPTTFGSLMSFRIPTDTGDFINRITLKAEFRRNPLSTFPLADLNVENLGFINPLSDIFNSLITNKLIEYVELFIGEQSIQKLTGEYIAIYNQSHARDLSTYEFLHAHGKNNTVGGHETNVGTFDGKATAAFTDTTTERFAPSVISGAENNPFFLDIPFYFHNINELAIPTCALKKHGIRVNIKLFEAKEGGLDTPGWRPTDDAFASAPIQNTPPGYMPPNDFNLQWGNKLGITLPGWFPSSSSSTVPTLEQQLFSPSLNVSYIHVGTEERSFIESSIIAHNIQQLQVSEFTIPSPPPHPYKSPRPAGILTKSVLLDFKNPVSELFFIAYHVRDLERDRDNSVGLHEPRLHRIDFVDIDNISLKFNNAVVFDRDNLFLRYKQSLDNHTRSPSGLPGDGGGKYCSYAFSLDPISGLPTGSVNMSRIIHKELKVDISYPFIGAYEDDGNRDTVDKVVRVYAVSHNVLMFAGGLAGLRF